MKALLFAILILSQNFVFPQDTTGNLLINGGFEQSNNGGMPLGWNGDQSIYSLSNEAASGGHSLQFLNGDSSIYRICTQTITLKPGETYSAGVTVKTSDINGNDFGASFCIEWLDKNNKWMGGVYPKGIKGTNNWTPVSAVITIPDTAGKVLFCCYVRKGMVGTAWFDDAYVKPFSTRNFNVMILQPVYRGLLIGGIDSLINISIKLANQKVNFPNGSFATRLINSSGKEVLKDIKEITAGRNDYNIIFDAKSIVDGKYKLTVSLSDKNSKPVETWNSDIEKINKAASPRVYFDEYKRLIVDGKAIFPLGMYWDSINEPDLKTYADSKFNFLLPYGKTTADQMKLAAKYNLKVIYSVKDYYAGTQFVPKEITNQSIEQSSLKNTIEQFKNSPALLAWYTNDELTPDYMERLDQHYKILSSEDPDHPVLSIFIYPDQSALYLNSTDIIGTDPYVVPKGKLYDVGKATNMVQQKIMKSRPVWMVIQTHNLGNYHPIPGFRSPTYSEMLSMSWQAICNGTNGLLYYSYFDLKHNKDVPFNTQWSDLKRIAAGIDSVSDVLLSVEKTGEVTVNGSNGDQSWFDWTTRKYKGHLYIFVIDNGKSAGEIKIKIPANYLKVHLLNNSMAKYTLSNSRFADNLGHLELKIFVAE